MEVESGMTAVLTMKKLRRFYQPKRAGGEVTAYDAGYDAGFNGANTTNCNFRLFDSRARADAWSQGQIDGRLERQWQETQ